MYIYMFCRKVLAQISTTNSFVNALDDLFLNIYLKQIDILHFDIFIIFVSDRPTSADNTLSLIVLL